MPKISGPDAKLTEQQESFCQEYIRNGGDKGAAYRAAGYKGTNPSKVYGLPNVQRRLIELIQSQSATTVLTKSQIREALTRIANDAEENGQYGNAIRALEILGKSMGMFIETIDHNVNMQRSREDVEAEITRIIGRAHKMNKSIEFEQEEIDDDRPSENTIH